MNNLMYFMYGVTFTLLVALAIVTFYGWKYFKDKDNKEDSKDNEVTDDKRREI